MVSFWLTSLGSLALAAKGDLTASKRAWLFVDPLPKKVGFLLWVSL